MLRIRLFRTGATKQPSYRIVVMDGRRQRQGRVLERLGTYDPIGGGAITMNEGALDRWVSRGARMSDTVSSLVRKHRKEAGKATEEAVEAAGATVTPEAEVASGSASPAAEESSEPLPPAT
jgi:small subunit ribosomal protein S16